MSYMNQLFNYAERWMTWNCPRATRNALRVKTQALILQDKLSEV